MHDARHTAATVLLILGQPERTVMSLMGWSTTNMAARYQHVTDKIRADVASQVDSLIWAARAEEVSADTVSVQRDSLAAVLPLAEAQLSSRETSMPSILTTWRQEAALADLRMALANSGADSEGESQ